MFYAIYRDYSRKCCCGDWWYTQMYATMTEMFNSNREEMFYAA